LGITAPIVALGFNFSSHDLLSQITSKFQKTNLSEVDPLESLGNVMAPLDSIWKAIIGSKLNLDEVGLLELLKSGPEARSNLQDTLGDISAPKALGMAKEVFIFVANILVAILETVVSILRGILGLIS